MDVKGVTWAANIYQKFEAMCLEVEEIMYQDTVKYVENQVQTVGASVKKFYSDVMEDLLPPDSLDPGKVANSEFILEQFSDVEVCKKLKPMAKKGPLKVDIGQLRKCSKAPGTVEKNHVAKNSRHGTLGVDNPSVSPVQNSSEKVARSELLGPGPFNNRNMPNGLAESAEASVSLGNTDFCSSQDLERNCKTSHQGTPSACSASSDSTHDDLIGHSTNETATRNEATRDPSMHSLPSDTSLLESGLAQSNEREKSPSSLGGISAVSQGADISWDNGTVSLGESSENEDFCSNIHEEIGFSNPVHGTVDHSDMAKLEESCIFVNGDDLQFVALTPTKSRPYKKKIRNAFSSRKRGSRTQEYKQLAAVFANNVKTNDERTSNSGVGLSSTTSPGSSRSHNLLGEPEWELL